MRAHIAAGLVLLSSAVSAEPFDWRKTLAQPPSPGNLAALVEYGSEPEVQRRWREALSDASAAVRAAAARASYAARAEAAAPDILKALSTETDARAAEEQLRAAFLLGARPETAVVLAALERTRPRGTVVAEMLARAIGIEVLEPRSDAAKLDPEGYLRADLVAAVHLYGALPLTRVASVVLRHDDHRDWAAVWAIASNEHTIDDGVVAASLMSGNPRLRAVTYWNLARDADKARALPDVVATTLASTPEAQPIEALAGAARDERAMFAFELLQRARGGKPRAAVVFLKEVCEDGLCGLPGHPMDVVSLFTDPERKLLVEKKALPEIKRLEASGALARGSLLAPHGLPEKVRSRTLDVRSDFPKGYVTGVADVVGCRLPKPSIVSAPIRYDAQGRPGPLPAPPESLEACEAVARALFASSHAPELAGSVAVMRIALGAEHLDCIKSIEARPEPTPAGADEKAGRRDVSAKTGGPVRIGRSMTEPKKIHDVRPVYPAIARSERVQGLVILEVTINSCGGVSDMIVLRGSASKALDEAALNAVGQWRYTPTLLNGEPVPVVMTVTVNFTLH